MDQNNQNENTSQNEDASLIKDLVDKATGPGDFNRLNEEDVDGGVDVMDLPQHSSRNIVVALLNRYRPSSQNLAQF